MIVRILGEGQWDVADEEVTALNELDAAVESAVDGGDRTTFSQSLDALLAAVRPWACRSRTSPWWTPT